MRGVPDVRCMSAPCFSVTHALSCTGVVMPPVASHVVHDPLFYRSSIQSQDLLLRTDSKLNVEVFPTSAKSFRNQQLLGPHSEGNVSDVIDNSLLLWTGGHPSAQSTFGSLSALQCLCQQCGSSGSDLAWSDFAQFLAIKYASLPIPSVISRETAHLQKITHPCFCHDSCASTDISFHPKYY
ncbi:unnamed protein product [Ixodes pacificus]